MMALPVVTTDIRGCREEVVDGSNGFLVKVGASDDLAGEVSVKVTVLSNEVTKYDISEMAYLSDDNPPILLIEDETCSSSCLFQSTSEEKSRTYQVVVEATDEAGNTSTATCETLVSEKETVSAGDPFFLLTSKEFIL